MEIVQLVSMIIQRVSRKRELSEDRRRRTALLVLTIALFGLGIAIVIVALASGY